VFLVGSAIAVAILIVCLISHDRRRAVIYGGLCLWWALAWIWAERHTR
jgi:hypothetical protein